MRNIYTRYLCLLFAFLFFTNVKAQTFVAPFGNLPDPNIFHHNGWYYYSGTNGSGIYLKKAQTLEGLKHTPLTRVFAPSQDGAPCCDFWAPEMFRINNKWYIYYTAKYTGEGQRTYVIENSADDPMTGTWVNRGKIYDSQNDLWAIDGTVLETNGQMYFIWSGVAKASDGDKPQRLYIARMTNPWTLQAGRVLLASPSLYNWEKDGGVNEGPAMIKNGGKIFLTYSANGCWTENYLIGTLYMTEGGNPLNPTLWTKHNQPIFTKYPDRDVYGPGHHSFFKSPDGKETWFTYHATPDAAGACDMGRTTRAQKVNWDANGFPSLGIADPTGAFLTAPSGEPAIPAGSVLPNGIYKIKPTSSTNKVLDVSGCSPMRGTNVAQWQDNGLDCQKWHIIATPDGYYSINAVKGGLALDVENCSSSNGANVRMWVPSGGDCQKWIIEPVSAGVYRIKSKKSGKVLDIQFGGDNNGANLQIYDYLGNAQQHFQLVSLDTYSPISWESYNMAGHFMRHQNGRARMDKNVTPEKDGQWRMVPGLAGKGVSFQSVNYPNSYLRHVNGEVWSRTNDGSTLFQEEATFYVRAGLADASKTSFESYKYPGSYIRHKNYLLYSEPVTAGTGYNDATFTKGAVNAKPVVSVTAPANNAVYTAPAATVAITATASDADGVIAKVEFFNGTTKLGEDATAPYTYSWTSVAAGTYTITAKATDNFGAVTTSGAITIKVNTLPSVSITAPTNNAVFHAPATVAIAATAADNDGTIAKVEFFNGTTKLGEDATAPYTYSWTGVAAGTYNITAKATDNNGGITTSGAIAIKVNALPTVSITAPANNAAFNAPATVNITATAADNDGTIAKVEFFNGTTKLGEDATAPYAYSWTGVVAGTYNITVKATDNNGGVTTSAAIAIKVNALPAVSITSPANNAVFTAPASISINANATDADGTITKVEFFNGTTKLGEDATAPYSYSWTNVAIGSYNITAKATDNTGAANTSTIVSVVVNPPDNVAPVTSITAPVNNATFTAPASININANATDTDGTVTKVEFFNGTTKLGEDATAPYSYSWTNVAAGTYSITVKATDNSGATTVSSAISVVVNAPANIAPVTAITTPANNAAFTAPAYISINANATDADGTITKVEFFNGTTKLGEAVSAPYTYNWINVTEGTYSITVKATDNSGAVTTSSAVSVVVNAPDNVAPVTTITAPANNSTFTAPASINIYADATDADGTIAKVDFYNGSTLLGTSTASPYSFTWSGVADGTYTITAKATDNNGTVTVSSEVLVIVNQTTSVGDVTLEKTLRTAPNPVQKQLEVLYTESLTNAQILVLDILGREVIKGIIPQSKLIDVNELQSGVYILIIHTEDGLVLKEKFVKD